MQIDDYVDVQAFLTEQVERETEAGNNERAAHLVQAKLCIARATQDGWPRAAFDLEAYLELQREWSSATFGTSARTVGICKHIAKELLEIQAEPESLEWVDVVILALDGAWRAGHSPAEIIQRMVEKQIINMAREWRDHYPEDEATDHVRDGEPH